MIRLIAAWTVLASHSYVLATGNLHAEPWQSRLGTTPGGMAVDIFFIVSGFLVTGSLLRTTIWEFSVARALRIYPALWIALIWTVCVIGFGFTSEPVPEFFSSMQTWKYLFKNSLMIAGAEADLPGAFADNIAPGVVNGSLWTLRHELRLYALLALLWLAIAHAIPSNRQLVLLQWTTLAIAVSLVLFCIYSVQQGTLPMLPKLAAMFFSGASYQLFRKKISLSIPVLLSGITALAAGALHSPAAFGSIYFLCLPYLVLFLAYRPTSQVLLKFNSVGDYSYGIYIYAFPIQQMVMAKHAGLSIGQLTLSATLLTLVFAIFSWHLVEKPALRHKERLTAGLTNRINARWAS